jgi:hypothetical protein
MEEEDDNQENEGTKMESSLNVSDLYRKCLMA